MTKLFKTGVSAEGDISTTGLLNVNASAGDEGGQIFLNKAVTNTSITTGVNIDVYQNKLRFWEAGGTNRGFYVDITGGGAGVATSLTGGSTGAMNYAQTVGTKQSAISTAGTTIVSVSITTNGYPTQVTVTGDVENNSAGGWVVLQLYRGSTAIGNPVHAESSAGSENVPYAISVVDAPAAGTYTYALKLNNSAGGTFNFGESNGPVITAVELSGPKGDTGSAGPTFTGGTLASNLTLFSGTTSSSPLKFQSGSVLTTAAAGAVEFDGTSLYFTPSTTRKTIAFTDSTMSGNTTGTAAGLSGTQTANTFYAAPNGSSGTASFRTIAVADVPTLNQNTTGTAAGLSGTQTANYVYAAPNGSTGTASFRALVAGDIPILNQNTTGTATNATNSTNVATTNDAATATSVYPTWVGANTGNNGIKTTSTALSFVPSTGTLTATAFSGSGASLTSLNASNIGSGTVPIGNLPTGTSGSTVALGNHTHSYLSLSGGALTGAVTFSDSTPTVEGRIIASSGVFYVQAGTDASDTSAVLTVARTLTTTTAISAMNIYANTTTITGATLLIPNSTSAVPLTVKAINSQISYLQEWRYANNALAAAMDTSGGLLINSLIVSGNTTSYGTINGQYTDWTYLAANFR